MPTANAYIDEALDALEDEYDVDLTEEDAAAIVKYGEAMFDQETGLPDLERGFEMALSSGELSFGPEDLEPEPDELLDEDAFLEDDGLDWQGPEGGEFVDTIPPPEAAPFGLTEDQFRVLYKRFQEEEAKHGVRLSDSEAFRVAAMVRDQGIELPDAVALVAEDHVAQQEQFEQDFQAGVDQIKAEIGRDLTDREVAELRQMHEADLEPGESLHEVEPDPLGFWVDQHGPVYDESAIQEAKQQVQQDLEDLRANERAAIEAMKNPGYGVSYTQEQIEAREQAARETIKAAEKEQALELEAIEQQMRRSGHGHVDLDDPEQRASYLTEQVRASAEQIGEPTEGVIGADPPALDADSDTVAEYITGRLEGKIVPPDDPRADAVIGEATDEGGDDE